MDISIIQPSYQEIEKILENADITMKACTSGQFVGSKVEAYRTYQNLLFNGAVFYIYKIHNRIAGWILLDNSIDRMTKQRNGWIVELFVYEEFRHRGIASKLIQHSFSYFKEHQCKEIKLNVYSHNPAYFLYEKLGFVSSSFTMSYVL